MDGSVLIQLVVFLAVAAFAAPIAKTLKLGSILGYLLAGAFILRRNAKAHRRARRCDVPLFDRA
jgi:Kef-type K+ transport system membrane component KefB